MSARSSPFGDVPFQGRHPVWERLYGALTPERLPWHCPTLDPDLARELDRRALTSGLFLDLGTGAGHQAAALAARGFTVVGTDVARSAIEQAARHAAPVTWLVDDILDTRIPYTFDFAFDRGLLHVLDVDQRPRFVAAAAGLLRPGGLLFLKCFSADEGPSPVGPVRCTPACVQTAFQASFAMESCVATVFHGPLPHQPKALFFVLRRLPDEEIP